MRHLEKKYTIQVYDQDGETLLRTLTTERPLDLSLMFCRNVPAFRSQINGGFGECVLDLNAEFDDFDEGDTVDFMNVVRIYAVVTDLDTRSQTETLIYSGFTSRYEAFIDEDGTQGVRATCLGLASLLTSSYYGVLSNFEVSHGSEDPTDIARAVVDHFATVYGGGLITYDGDSIPDAVGATVSVIFTDQKWFDALKRVGLLAGEGWWWNVDHEGKYNLKAKPSEATHTFTIGRDVLSISAPKDSEKVANDVWVRYDEGVGHYQDTDSQSRFGTGSPATGRRTVIISDPGLNLAAADQRGGKELADGKDDKLKASLSVSDNYEGGIESIRVGQTCRVLNYDGDSDFFDGHDNMMIVAVSYEGTLVRIDLEEESGSFGPELQKLVEETAASAAGAASSGGGSSVTYADREVPTGSINGSNTNFTLAHTPDSGSEHVYLNGVLQNGSGNDYTLVGTTITFVSAPPSGSTLLVSYRY